MRDTISHLDFLVAQNPSWQGKAIFYKPSSFETIHFS